MTDGFGNDLRGEFRGDFSRSTFQRAKRYSSVRLQQGRVQLDADWNEQVDIQADRDRTTTYDAVGPRGAPLHDAGFGVTVSIDGKSIEIGAGRLYVDGIFCENDVEVDFTKQQDLPDAILPPEDGRYLAYLDVWQRHITALEDPSLREVALGGPDTATRTRTVWQVKLKKIGATDTCGEFGSDWEPDEASSTGELRARAKQSEDAGDICAVPPGAGYTRLENQLYRVEIHDGGEAYGPGQTRSSGPNSEVVKITPADKKVEVANDGRAWKVDQWVELYSEGSTAPGKLARITAVDASGRTLTLGETISSINNPRLRRVATFKFSRDNGSVVSRMEKITGDFVTVTDPGKDPVLRFEGGQWVELSDEVRALRGEPGVLVRLGPVTGNNLKVIWPNNKALTTGNSPTHNDTPPTVRRWDCKDGPMPVKAGKWLDLEDGVQVEFDADKEHAAYRTGDYWQIPARTLTADVEWPQSEPDAKNKPRPLFKPRHGIEHHFCPLAILNLTGATWTLLQDCRMLFPPLTQLTSLHYVSGDGQEAMPDGVLPRPLQVRVLNGGQPVAGASVEFRITPNTGGSGIVKVGTSSGTVSGNAVTTQTATDGMAECVWKLDASTQSQQVEAFLLDAANQRISLPIRFNANLSVARQVAYEPGFCNGLDKAITVQTAIERFSNLSSLFYVGGDGQEVMPADWDNLQPLEVLVANACGPVSQAKVEFVSEEGGRLDCGSGPAGPDASGVARCTAVTGDNGIATCDWDLGPTVPVQRVTATLVSAPDVPNHPNPIQEPLTVRFIANLSVAEQVAYTPPDDCPPLAGTATVKQALDALCGREGGECCSVTVGEGGRYESLREALEDLKDRADVCICMLPGQYEIFGEPFVGGHRSVEISGCALGVRLFIREPVAVRSVAYFGLKNVEVRVKDPMRRPIAFDGCGEVRLDTCRITGIVPKEEALIAIGGSDRIHLENNRIQALPLDLEQPLGLPLEVFGQVDGSIASLFEIRNRLEFEDAASQVSRELSGLSTDERRELAAAIREVAVAVLGDHDPTGEERESYERFARALELEQERGLLVGRLLERLSGIRDAAAPLSLQTAIVIEEAGGDVTMEGNEVSGVISLYGPPGETRVDDNHLRRLGPLLRQGAVRLTESSGILRMLNNEVTRLRIAEEMARRIIEVSSGRGEITGLYSRSFWTDNVIVSGDNLLLAYHLAISSNAFNSLDEERVPMPAGAVIGDAASYVGNHATNADIPLENVSRVSEKAANLELNIIDL